MQTNSPQSHLCKTQFSTFPMQVWGPMVKEGNLLTQGVSANILGYRVAGRHFSGESIKTIVKVHFEYLHKY